jgi:energy-coupling factor transport system substrate-specific component
MNPLAWIQGLEGPGLIVAICLLLFIEECGVPLPFAPGDLVLAIAGIAIAGGRVSALAMVAAVFAATTVGAAVGREIFALVGWDRLLKLADRLRARKPLERASGLLRRSGWRGVFTARLIPGLRIYTTQVAGVSRMPRLTFYVGLVPASALYVAAFVGLGAAFGRPILELIRAAEHQVLIAALVLLLAVVLFLLSRSRVRTTLAALEVAGWTGLRFRVDSPRLYLIPACIGINFAGHAIAVGLGLPLFLDSIGTVLCAVLAGPWVGGSVGLITNLVSSNTVDPIAAPYSVVSFAVGFAAGLGGYLSWHRQRSGWISLWLACFVIASVVSTPINVLANGGRSGVPLGDAITAFFTNAHFPALVAAYAGEAAIDLPDKFLTVVAVLLIYQALPQREAVVGGVELDLGDAATYVFRSRDWFRKFLVAALCVLFFWVLLIPYFLLIGYSVALARNIRGGRHELPAWDHIRQMLKDGFLVSLLLLTWQAPGIVLSAFDLPATLVAAGGLWGLLILIAQPAISSQYLQGGFRSGFNIAAVARRIRFNLGLTVVVGALGVVLLVAALSGVFALLIGVLLTVPYAICVNAYLLGTYAQATDAPALQQS